MSCFLVQSFGVLFGERRRSLYGRLTHQCLDPLNRANTPFARALDEYQKSACEGWLQASLSPILRLLVRGEWELNKPALMAIAKHWNDLSESTNPKEQSSSRQEEQEKALDQFVRLVAAIWTSVQRHVHMVPSPLRRILGYVKSRIASLTGSPEAGVQSVGAFVILRLIGPALVTPHLFRLVPMPPSEANQTQAVLKLLAKVFVSMANPKSHRSDELAETPGPSTLPASPQSAVMRACAPFLREQEGAYRRLMDYLSPPMSDKPCAAREECKDLQEFDIFAGSEPPWFSLHATLHHPSQRRLIRHLDTTVSGSRAVCGEHDGSDDSEELILLAQVANGVSSKSRHQLQGQRQGKCHGANSLLLTRVPIVPHGASAPAWGAAPSERHEENTKKLSALALACSTDDPWPSFVRVCQNVAAQARKAEASLTMASERQASPCLLPVPAPRSP